jgi:hypothetical protein
VSINPYYTNSYKDGSVEKVGTLFDNSPAEPVGSYTSVPRGMPWT